VFACCLHYVGLTFLSRIGIHLPRTEMPLSDSSNAQASYALKRLRAHGLCETAIEAVFRSVVLTRFQCASPAWWGFAGAQDRQIDGLIHRLTPKIAKFCFMVVLC